MKKNNVLQKFRITAGMIPLFCCISVFSLWLIFHFYASLHHFFLGLLIYCCSLCVMLSVRFLRHAFRRRWEIICEKNQCSGMGSLDNRLQWEIKNHRVQLIYRVITAAVITIAYYFIVTKIADEGGGLLLTSFIVILTLEHIMNTKRFGDLYKKLAALDAVSCDEKQLEDLLSDDRRLLKKENVDSSAESV